MSDAFPSAATAHPVVRYEVEEGVAVLTLDNPPVNAIGAAVRADLMGAVRRAEQDPTVRALLLVAAGRAFSAGADLNELNGRIDDPPYAEAFGVVEGCSKPVAVCVSGATFGAGVELALACHYRAATTDAKLILPEITLGVVPGAGATQRLPRLVGARRALEIMVDGAPTPAERARSIGLIDEVVAGSAREGGLSFLAGLLKGGAGPRPTRDRAVDAAGFEPEAVEAYLAGKAKALKGRTTQHAIADAVRAAVDLPFDEGLAEEKRISDASLRATEAKALIHAFFSEREVTRIPELDPAIQPAPIRKAAVVGAGTMGGGIAMAFADSGVPVALIEAKAENLERGLGNIRKSYEAMAARGRLSPEALETRIGLIQGSLDMAAASNVDVVVEAVFENMALKKSVMAQIDTVAPPHAILASNTSSLSITELANGTTRPDKVIGLHFFVPANVMRLLEIVRARQTSAQTLVTGAAVARLLRKIGVVVGDAFGFVGNRMMMDGFWREADLMMLEGVPPERVDQAIEAWGFAMGPAGVNDMAGVDVGAKMRAEGAAMKAQPAWYHALGDALAASGRVGQKGGKGGFYRYEPGERAPKPDPEVQALAAKLAAKHGIERRGICDSEISERAVLSLINVGAEVLGEGLAYRAGDIDVIWNNGFGFPRWRGGPMFYADTLGLSTVVERIRRYEARYGAAWAPAALLRSLAEQGKSFTDYDRERAG